MSKYRKADKLTQEQRKEIAFLVNAGIPYRNLAKYFSVSIFAIHSVSRVRNRWIATEHITTPNPDHRFRFAQMIYSQLPPHWQKYIFTLFFEPIIKFIQIFFVCESRERLFFKEVLGPKCLPDISKKSLDNYRAKIRRYVLDIFRNNEKEKIIYDDIYQAIVCMGYLIIKFEEAHLPKKERKVRKLLKGRIDHILCTLDLRENTVLNVRYDPERGYLLTLEEIGKRFGITAERTRQIRDEAFAKLRQPQKAEKIRKLLDLPGVRQWVQRPIIYLSDVPRAWKYIREYTKLGRRIT